MSVSKNPKLQYLKQRGGLWYLNHPIPKDLQAAYLTSRGMRKTHIVRALNTADREEAYRRKLTAVKLLLDEFDHARRKLKGLLTVDLRQAAASRASYFEAIDSGDMEYAETLSLAIHGMAEAIHEDGGGTATALAKAKQFYDIAHGAKPLLEAFEDWMSRANLPVRTQAKYRTAVGEFARFVGGDLPLVDRMTRRTAIRYVDWLNSEGRSQRTKKAVPLSYNSKRDRVMALSAFWNKHLSIREKMPEATNPWSKLQITERPTGTAVQWDHMGNAGRAKRRPYFDDEDLVAILNAPGPKSSKGTRYGKRTLMEVFALGLITGARPDEICSLRLGDIRKSASAHWLNFSDAKNAESDRRIPVVHPLAAAVLDRRIAKREGREEQLFAEFRPKEGQTSLYELVGRALARHLQRATALQAGAVPYCTRHTLQTRLGSREDVKDAVMQRYVGHKPIGMTDRHYRSIPDDALLGFAQKVSYPTDIERRLAQELALELKAETRGESQYGEPRELQAYAVCTL